MSVGQLEKIPNTTSFTPPPPQFNALHQIPLGQESDVGFDVANMNFRSLSLVFARGANLKIISIKNHLRSHHLFHSLTSDAAEALYGTMILPIYTYCCILPVGLPDSSLKK